MTLFIGTHEISIEKSQPFLLKMYERPGGSFQVVNIQKRGKPISFKEIRLEKLWPQGQALSKEKIKDLKDLLQFLPSVDQQTFSFLENIAQRDSPDDVDGFGDQIDFALEKEI